MPIRPPQYAYDGFGRMIGMHYDVTDDGTNNEPDGVVDSNDPWYRFVYDGVQVIATYRGSDSDPKEHFYYNKAGLDGAGGSSYVNDIFCRDRDADTDWFEEADGTMEERRYLMRNWRGDTSAILDDSGNMDEWVKYSAYGVPFGLPAGDSDSDGDYDATDVNNFGGTYDVREDTELDGDLDIFDQTAPTIAAETLAWGVLSGIGNRSGYAGYRHDPAVSKICHVRARKYNNELGRFTTRDPLGYVDGMSLYQYVGSMTTKLVDPHGLEDEPPGCIAYDDCGCRGECTTRALQSCTYEVLSYEVTSGNCPSRSIISGVLNFLGCWMLLRNGWQPSILGEKDTCKGKDIICWCEAKTFTYETLEPRFIVYDIPAGTLPWPFNTCVATIEANMNLKYVIGKGLCNDSIYD